ncbi:membrane-associated phospholipid phosphatase [Hydrogenispora ethanolica]|uniref:Membrane-associated phospholipid phosphatase n=1 Tax=Hydrogenispora ethanolica TaxID=1082276 RepID=A0A4R1RK78_HYDET|nr:phosphatase PAP2 family protein [Hydrogenispora ethanolica]TCL66583.1 membrane-associated phospholipid phosphatase [Hydrogenispora ethanolica]
MAFFRITLLVMCLLCSWNGTAWASDSGAAEAETDPYSFGKQCVADFRTLLAAPLDWEREEWQKAGWVLAITAGLYLEDGSIRDSVQERRNEDTDRLARWTRPFGDIRVTAPLLAGFYYWGSRTGDEQATRAALLAGESLVVSGMLTAGLKLAGHRRRPDSGAPYDAWDGPGFSLDHDSFPSYHTASSFAIATILSDVYREKRYLPPLAYSLAALTGWSRVNDDVHWASDVFAGAVIGYATAKMVLAGHSDAGRKISLQPTFGADGRTGLVGTVRF